MPLCRCVRAHAATPALSSMAVLLAMPSSKQPQKPYAKCVNFHSSRWLNPTHQASVYVSGQTAACCCMQAAFVR